MKSLREWRTGKMWTVRAFAKAAGVSTKTVIELEHGRQRPHYKTMRMMAETLGVDPLDVQEFAATISERGSRPAVD